MPKFNPPPHVAPETWKALFAAASDFAALKPWAFAFDSDIVGLIDPVTGETRIGCVLGNAGEVFGTVIYRRNGLRWILSMLYEAGDPENINTVEGMDCLKLEFVPKRELWKEDLERIKAADFKPAGRGCVWPHFRSAEPGWHPWHINQAEADQLLADLPRLTAFHRMFESKPALFEDRAPAEIPFLPVALPDRPLTPDDLDWRPLLPPPAIGLEPYRPTVEQLDKLGALDRKPGLECEFDSSILPGGSFPENGRPCCGRIGLLVENQAGLVLGMNLQSGGLSRGEAAGCSLTETLLMAGNLPERLFIGDSQLQPVLQPLCDKLDIQLRSVSSLPALEEATASLSQYMRSGQM